MSPSRAHPVAWLEGMFLRPQHLQQQDRYWDGRLSELARSLDPFHWGVRELVLNEEALGDHRVEVVRLDAVLPGGVRLQYPGGCALEMREFDPTRESLDLWIGLRHPSPGEPASAPAESAVRDVRYRVRTEELPDANRADGDAPVQLLVPNARLFLSGEELEVEQHDALRLGRIAATGELKRPFALADDGAPPLLAVQAWAPLQDAIERLLGQMGARIRVVAGRTTTIAVADLPRMWLRYTLSRVTPQLRHALSSGATPPFPLYGTLVEAAGALAAFALQEEAELPPYDHANPYPCFRELLAFIEDKLEEVVPHRFHELEMRFEKGVYTTRELGRELADPSHAFYLGIQAKVSADELKALVQENGRCASADDIGALTRFFLSGLKLEPLPAAPTDIAARADALYWRIEPRDGRLWSGVRDKGTLSLSLGNLVGASVRLYVVTGEG